MTVSEELQRLLYSTLTGSTAIMALAGGVYDRVPDNPFKGKTAYISLGATDSAEDDAECIAGLEINVTIHVWSTKVGALECKTLVDLVRKAMHRQSLQLSEHALVDTWVETTRTFADPDPLTTHGIVQLRCMVEEQ